MPKVVDAAARRVELAEAVWRVVRRGGLAHASVRNVALEAGLSTGSLRHSFGSQSELTLFAMRLVAERIQARVEAVGVTGDPQEVAGRMIEEMLPLDEDRLAECQVWLSFSAQSVVDPQLGALREEMHGLLWHAFRSMVARVAGPGADQGLEARRLYALVDGLILHTVLHGEDPAGARSVIRAHLRQLADPTRRP
ncbi:DNA-binding transcriptional regulator, AcrR family [Micromonospora phaseoli]|uniref:DNA-binding transcriptional regulator, AcrR family n=1 Tax=Micromonospora phaseoli TaxID=1144548 RepID=A0A1H7CQD5_9ACTN|nr:TetR family transcriptional regulator C-terminal domain-containing protein [Micromonospora phaseoli]PZV91638.1 AcrR family transcriptional regulator [Micromonospora phaseoli]GIJ79269.1 HTH-type transcriptional regulator PksA [Micromonospora phaseoli]SEJ91424.1 DNA-binding transcriptional regulator, AcrR family [Micromonospora phaseoli]